MQPGGEEGLYAGAARGHFSFSLSVFLSAFALKDPRMEHPTFIFPGVPKVSLGLQRLCMDGQIDELQQVRSASF